MALADISVEEGDDSGDRLLISVDQLADKFVRYYWRQVVPFPGNNPLVIFRQNNNPGEAEIVRQVRESREQYQTPSNMKMQDPDGWDHLLEAVGGVVDDMPLWRLQTVDNARLDFLYENMDNGDEITLQPG